MHEFCIAIKDTPLFTQCILMGIINTWNQRSAQKVIIWNRCIIEFDLHTSYIIFPFNLRGPLDMGEAYRGGLQGGSPAGDDFDFSRNSIGEDLIAELAGLRFPLINTCLH
jgi:hypothetical protein